MTTDPYEILGVPPEATLAEIEARYRLLLRRHHPDLHHAEGEAAVAEAQARTQQLTWAMDVIRGTGTGGRTGRRGAPSWGPGRSGTAGPAGAAGTAGSDRSRWGPGPGPDGRGRGGPGSGGPGSGGPGSGGPGSGGPGSGGPGPGSSGQWVGDNPFWQPGGPGHGPDGHTGPGGSSGPGGPGGPGGPSWTRTSPGGPGWTGTSPGEPTWTGGPTWTGHGGGQAERADDQPVPCPFCGIPFVDLTNYEHHLEHEHHYRTVTAQRRRRPSRFWRYLGALRLLPAWALVVLSFVLWWMFGFYVFLGSYAFLALVLWTQTSRRFKGPRRY